MNRFRHHQKDPRHRSKRLVMAVTAILIASLLLLVVTKPQMLLGMFHKRHSGSTATATTGDPAMIAVFGTDSQDTYGAGQIDSCFLVKFDKSHRHVDVLSIPADTLLQYPDGHKGTLKSALLFGGPTLAVQLIRVLTNQPVSSYVVLHYSGFIKFINAIGGVPVTVQKSVNYYTGGMGTYAHIHLKSGFQTLNGLESLEYVRFKDKPSGNTGRLKRQQNFIEAAVKKLDEPRNIANLPAILKTGWDSVDTNLTASQVAGFALNAKQFTSWPLSQSLLPGKATRTKRTTSSSAASGGDTSEWKVNAKTAPKVITNLFDKGQGQSLKQGSQRSKKQSKETTAKQGSRSTAASVSKIQKPKIVTTPVRHHTMTVTASANIRSGPATSYKIVASAGKGDNVTVIGKSNGWYQIIISGTKTGYIAGWLVKSASATLKPANAT